MTFHTPPPPGTRDPDCAHGTLPELNDGVQQRDVCRVCGAACMLLSPARAIEWIYVDGLRQRYGWNSTAGGA